jgi:hypothetical protein
VGRAGCAASWWSPSSLLGRLAAVASGSAGAGDGGEAGGSCRLLERRAVVSPARGRCCSGFGVAASTGEVGLAGASGAVAGVAFGVTGVVVTVGEALVAGTREVAGRAWGRAAVGGGVMSPVSGPRASTCAIAPTVSADTTIARAESPMICLEGRRGPGAWKTSGPARNQVICCSWSWCVGVLVAN